MEHANYEGNGPQYSKEQGWTGSPGPPQPQQQRQKLHQASVLLGGKSGHTFPSGLGLGVVIPSLFASTRAQKRRKRIPRSSAKQSNKWVAPLLALSVSPLFSSGYQVAIKYIIHRRGKTEEWARESKWLSSVLHRRGRTKGCKGRPKRRDTIQPKPTRRGANSTETAGSTTLKDNLHYSREPQRATGAPMLDY